MFVTKAAISFTVGAVLSAVGKAAVGATFGISKSQALAGGDVNSVPLDFTIEKIVSDYLAPYDWTGTSNTWTPVDARLAGSLLIYGALS